MAGNIAKGVLGMLLMKGTLASTPAWCVTDAHGYNCEGNTLKTVTGITAHVDCCSACTDYGESCQAWTWHYSTQECMLKSSCVNVTAGDEYHTSWPRGGPTPPPTPSPPTPSWYGSGKVQDKSFWTKMRGIGFSPADDRGPSFSKEHPPQIARLDDALTKVAQNGFNFIRTWHTNDYQELMLKHIHDRKLPIKVQLGVDISDDASATQLIDQAAAVALRYPDLILSLSIGNENIKRVSATAALAQAKYTKEKYGVPVTYDFLEGTIHNGGSDVVNLCAELDYLSQHNYGNWFWHRNDAWYTADQYVADLQNDLQAVANKVGHLGKPVIVGETGWQSNMYGDSSVAKLQEYYTKITKHVYQVRDPNIQSMAFFELCDEQWKGGDDAWGLYEQGDAATLGKAKFTPINVDEIVGLSHSDTVASDEVIV